MSVSLILIPAAFAMAAAVGSTGIAGVLSLGRETDAETGGVDGTESGPASVRAVSVQTRMKDPTLLAAALEDLGALHASVTAEGIEAVVDGVRVTMTRTPDEVWAAHLEATDGREVTDEEAADLVSRLDVAYARRVQRAVAERIRARADDSGFDLVSETTEDDETITMVLNVRDDA